VREHRDVNGMIKDKENCNSLINIMLSYEYNIIIIERHFKHAYISSFRRNEGTALSNTIIADF
jgi:hypothetical protein